MQWATFRLQDASSRARTGLILCGIASLAIWIAALFFHEAIGPLGGFIVRRTGVPGVGPVWLMLALFVPYLIAYRIVSRVEVPRARRIIIAFAALSCFVLAARIMPTASFDIYLYAFQGREIAIHGLNPYAVPASMVADPFTPVMGKFLAGMKAVYGPLWLTISALTAAVVGGDPVNLVIAFKLLASAFFLGCVALLPLLADAIAPAKVRRPALSSGALLLFAWNPSVIFEFAGNGHNDVAMIFFLLLSILLTVRRRWAFAGLAIAASILIKYVTVLCLPFLLLYAVSGKDRGIKQKARAAASMLLAAGAAIVVAFAPYWIGSATFDGLLRQSTQIGVDVSSPLVHAGANALRWFRHLTLFERWETASSIASAIFMMSMVMIMYVAYKKKVGTDDLHRFSFAPIVGYLLLACVWFMPWYLTWIAPVLILEGAAAAAIVMSLFGFLLYSAFFTGPLIGAAIALTAVVVAVNARLDSRSARREASKAASVV